MIQVQREKENQNPSTQNAGTTKGTKSKHSVPIPPGKLTKFGYSADFAQRYEKGKLLGHGQFGFTYVATSLSSGEKVAVKVIEKKKVCYAWNVFTEVLHACDVLISANTNCLLTFNVMEEKTVLLCLQCIYSYSPAVY